MALVIKALRLIRAPYMEDTMHNTLVSDLRKRLSREPDILGREEYINSAVLVPVVLIDGEKHLLFEKRAAHIRQGSEICFPGGHHDKEKDTSSLGTALRETHEELGVDPDSIEIVAQLDTLVSPRGIIVDCFLGYLGIDNMNELVIDTREVEEVFTVPFDWFMKNPPEMFHTRVEIQSSYKDKNGKEHVLLPVEELGLPLRYKENRSEWRHKVAIYRKEPHIIWGLTAAIVYNFFNKTLSS